MVWKSINSNSYVNRKHLYSQYYVEYRGDTILHWGVISSVVRRYGRRGRCGAQRGKTQAAAPSSQSRRRAEVDRRAPAVSGSWLWTGKHLDSAEMMPLLLLGRALLAFAALFLNACVLEPTLVLAFNLDTSHVIRKDGEAGSLFGFSMAMHRQLNPDKRMWVVSLFKRVYLSYIAIVFKSLFGSKVPLRPENTCQDIHFKSTYQRYIQGRTGNKNGPGLWLGQRTTISARKLIGVTWL